MIVFVEHSSPGLTFQNSMKILFVLLLSCHVALAVRHTLKYQLTESSGLQDFPEFVGTAMIDDIEFGYCDSNTKTARATTDWVKKLIKNDPSHLEYYNKECLVLSQIFKAKIDKLKQILNQSEGAHILQTLSGCEWDDTSGETVGFVQFGYDGEDLLILDLKTMTWMVPKYHMSASKLGWETDKAKIRYQMFLFISVCSGFLKKYVHYGKFFLQRTDLPSVSLLQKSPSSPVTCHATGFYPRGAVIFWRKDGEELFEDVDHGDILPNHDGSFQMSVDLLRLPSEDWGSYECVFQLSGVKEDIVTKLEKAAIRSNKGSEFHTGPVAGGIVGLLLLSVCIAGLFVWRKNNNGFQLATREQGASEEEAELQ